MKKNPDANQSSPPGDRELGDLLGGAFALWTKLHVDLAKAFGPLSEKWSYSTRTQRWSLQLKDAKKKRTVLYMIPARNQFTAAFALGEKACQAARESGLPVSVLEAIDAATKYPEGRGLWLEVRSRRDIENVEKLARIKMAT